MSSGRCYTGRRVPNSDEGTSLGLGQRITWLPRIQIHQAPDAALSAILRPSRDSGLATAHRTEPELRRCCSIQRPGNPVRDDKVIKETSFFFKNRTVVDNISIAHVKERHYLQIAQSAHSYFALLCNRRPFTDYFMRSLWGCPSCFLGCPA